MMRASIGISQRDINYYEFLADMKDELETTIHEFFEDRVRDQFEGDNCKHIFMLLFSPLLFIEDDLFILYKC